MKLRQKTLLVIILTLIGLISILYLVISTILFQNVQKAEQQRVEQSVDGFVGFFKKIQENFSNGFRDWSSWDATYDFLQTRTPLYIKENLIPNTFETFKSDRLLFVKNSGELVLGWSFDHELTRDMLPLPLQQAISPGSMLLKHAHNNSIYAGLLLMPDNISWIVSLPVLTGAQMGPIHGSLVITQILKTEYWQQFSNFIHLSHVLHRLDDPYLPVEFQTVVKKLSLDHPIEVLPRDKNIVSGYTLLYDIYQKPALILRLDVPRVLYQQGLKSLYYLTGSLLIGGLVFMILTVLLLEKFILSRLATLTYDIEHIGLSKDLSLRVHVSGNDELPILAQTVNMTLDGLEQSQKEIAKLNERLKQENLRMGAELEISRQLQQMILPTQDELSKIKMLDIAAFMKPADEVGGDYYDILQHENLVKIGIGDVTGHGLASGVLMLMVQMAVRTLLINNVTDLKTCLNVLNRALYDNVRRMQTDKNLTLCLLNYQEGKTTISGQHEEVLVVRRGGEVERVDTFSLGFIVGLEESIADFINEYEVYLEVGDGIVLYTDGITEAPNIYMRRYGIERLCEVIQMNWTKSALEIQQSVVEDLLEHIGTQKLFDDITLVIFKRK